VPKSSHSTKIDPPTKGSFLSLIFVKTFELIKNELNIASPHVDSLLLPKMKLFLPIFLGSAWGWGSKVAYRFQRVCDDSAIWKNHGSVFVSVFNRRNDVAMTDELFDLTCIKEAGHSAALGKDQQRETTLGLDAIAAFSKI
jgi:hypothetical protein